MILNFPNEKYDMVNKEWMMQHNHACCNIKQEIISLSRLLFPFFLYSFTVYRNQLMINRNAAFLLSQT